jgi:uroporphyrin-III C-methyltransferase/precorrin-2 dehydrogenase/sirohydrochlorin ferrochelatase
MAALVARGPASGTITLNARQWCRDDLAGAAVAIADADDEEEAGEFWRAARSAGVPVNVIDKPAYCTFQLGSIVNRSPVVIGISTDGAAPIFGQAIRRRLEAVLPPSIAAWGALAKSIRAEVGQRLAAGAQRRAFWERLAEWAFKRPPSVMGSEAVSRLLSEVSSGVARERGRVTLVGAGPGEPEHLTLKAVRALQSADVILYDDLVADGVLELARREAKRVCVGKRGHGKSCRQDDINSLMLRLARNGRHVVRLKSGDPMIFGRAGEEIDLLERNAIPVEVVPGITSASAMAARLGVSLTHRNAAHSVRFVTGHNSSGELASDLDWRGLADPATTLVIYMGGRTVKSFAARLAGEGLSLATPAVAVSGVTWASETRWRGSLGDLLRDGVPQDAAGPVLIGLGSVFRRVAGEVASAAPRVAAAAQ